MKIRFALCLCAALAGQVLLPAVADDDIVDGEILVTLKPTTTIDAILADYDLVEIDSIPRWRLFHLHVPQGSAGTLEALESDPRIQDAEPHRVFDTPEGGQLSIPDLDLVFDDGDYFDQPSLPQVNAAAATARYTGAGVTVAVLDTGVDRDHATLQDAVILEGRDYAGGDGTSLEQNNGLDDDGDGLIDESAGHGTFVAGLIRLVAPDARILPVRVLDSDGKGTVFGVAKGILYALDSGADVINLSLGMTFESEPLDDAIRAAKQQGVLVVAAAGNRGVEGIDFPASASSSIAVAAVDSAGVRAAFSSYGEQVDISAPGVDLLSTYPDPVYANWSGTSFATPLVSAAAALVRQRYPSLDADDFRELLAVTAQPGATDPALAGKMGAGLVDLDALTQGLADDRTSLRVSRSAVGAIVSWSPVIGAPGYDVIRGDVAQLVEVDPDPATASSSWIDLGVTGCLAANVTATDTAAFPDDSPLFPGEGVFYLFRVHGDTTNGYNVENDDDDALRVVTGGDCPP